MEILFGFVVLVFMVFSLLRMGSSGPSQTRRHQPRSKKPSPPIRVAKARPRPGTYAEPQHARTLKGKAWVIDGDTIVIDKVHIRLAGIDAPELNHPWGRKSKSAMIELCKGQIITAELLPDTTYERAVGICRLADGRDLAAELVKMGLAIDWPKYSGGRYGHLEPEGIRKKLWRADAKQKGRYDEKRHG